VSITGSRVLQEVHPWLRVRLEWLGEVARILGGKQTLISGTRTRAEQLRLYNDPNVAVVAYPGCSQHQYGFAADALYLPFTQISSKGKPILFRQTDTDRIMGEAARHVGLRTVSGDPGHVQIYPGPEFKAWAIGFGFCTPNPPARNFPESFPLLGGRVDQLCGTGFTGFQIREGVVTCLPERHITSLPGE